MIPNHSPWIKQLNRTRPVVPLAQDIQTEIAVVGGGIAGVITAYFTLRDTDKNVVLLEAGKIAHGATGHNAGQLVSYFERPFASIVKEFGTEKAVAGQQAVESAWSLIETLFEETKLQTPLHRFTGYAGLSSFEQLELHLEENLHRVRGGLQAESILVTEESGLSTQIPEKYKDLWSELKRADMLALLETENEEYVACLSYSKGVMNSALFCEELTGYLSLSYPDRFRFFEESPVQHLGLTDDGAVLAVGEYEVAVERVVLCTNGFENFTIDNAGGPIDTKFHHLVRGRIGYMAGYVEPMSRPPTAISFYPQTRELSGDPTGEAYYYFTRRPFESDSKETFNLVCAGGPEKVLPNDATYSRDHACSEYEQTLIYDFLRDNYRFHQESGEAEAFCWHGLMGYTPNGIRRIGAEPCNPALLYNLGCNGVGILPSIYGGKRVAQLLNGESLPPSIFDPVDQRCEIE